MKIILFVIILINSIVALEPIDINQKKISILGHCDMAKASKEEKLEHLKNRFSPLDREHLNLGVSNKLIWLHCQLENSSNRAINRVIYLSSPLLERITFIEGDRTIQRGMLVDNSFKQDTIAYYFPITLSAKSHQDYYLKIETIYTPLDFSMFLEERIDFLNQDRVMQMLDIFLLGIVVALMLYAFILSFYIRDSNYLFYALYLLALIYQQVTYLGLMPLLMPFWFVELDTKITIIKISFLIITSSLFSMSFLEIRRTSRLYWGYIILISFSLLEAFFLNPTKEISLYLMIAMGAIFILYNLIVGIIIYLSGKKEARLFIVGFILVFFSYLLMIMDALGIASMMLPFRNLLIWTTAIEALILSLAFADRYLILQNAKANIDRLMLEASKNRESMIQSEVVKKTNALNQALHEKELLMQEIHHRVKNNLQIILSMIRLQSDRLSDKKSKEVMSQLESRVNAIAKIYSDLITKESLELVNMEHYLTLLLDDMVILYGSKEAIIIEKNIEIKLPFKKAVYIGLIVNELISNVFKHAFERGEGKIIIALYQKNEMAVLEVKDNGKGFKKHAHTPSLGLILIETLVVMQLKGSFECSGKEGTTYKIRFRR